MKQKDVLKKVWKYLEHYRMLILLSFLFSIAVVVLTLYVPILVGRAIDQIVETGVHFGTDQGLSVCDRCPCSDHGCSAVDHEPDQ